MKKASFILATLLILGTGAAQACGCVCIVRDPTGTPLNVRNQPSGGSILGTLKNGARVVELDSSDKWTKIAPLKWPVGKTGWVFRQFLECEADKE
jgi:hypothetical protein